MRWIFLDPLNPQEAAYRAEKLRQIGAWWDAFREKIYDLNELFAGRAEWDLASWMGEHLQAVDEGLMWEFGPAVRGGGHRLVITPESKHYLRPLVNSLLSRAPEIAGWEFYSYRLPESEAIAVQAVKARTGGEITGAKVQADLSETGKVDLVFALPQCGALGDQETLYQAFIAAETLLGEEMLDTWIGAIEVEPLPKSGLRGLFRKAWGKADLARLVSLEQLRPLVLGLVEQQRNRLPAEPSWQWVPDAKWTVYELKPGPASDYPRRNDLAVASTARPDVFAASSMGGLFHSTRLSRCGEVFCYVKLDRSDGKNGNADRFLDREPLENALNARLIPGRLGCVIGGGTGLRYTYIDLALTDLHRGVSAVREVLREQQTPLRTWVQFFDDALAEEWVGVHSDAPPPP